MEAVDEPRRDDADHARVPAFAAEHDRAAVVGVQLLIDRPAAIACSRIFFSIAWRALFCCFEVDRDLARAVSASARVSISTASRAWPIRPQALSRGASRKPT